MPESDSRPIHEARDLPTLTSFRWYAALLVFVYHSYTDTDWHPLHVFGFGQVGVSFFFVLSGFVLTWSFKPTTTAPQFYWRRFARIYPSHLTMFVVVALLAAFWKSVPFEVGPVQAITNLTLTQAWTSDPLGPFSYDGPSWSLSAETFFYLLFPFIFMGMNRLSGAGRLRAVAVVLTAGLLTTTLLGLRGWGDQIAFPDPLVRLPEFVLGIGLAMFVQTHRLPSRRLWLPVLGIAVSVVAATKVRPFPLEDYVLLPAVGYLLVVGAFRDLANTKSLLTHPISVYFGQLSFCFYLVHQVVLRVLANGIWPNHPTTGPRGILLVLVALVCSIAAAAALHHGVEKPCHRLLARRRVSPPRHRLDRLPDRAR